MSIEQIKRCFISHQVATAMCLRAQQKTKTKRIHHNVEMIIYDWIFFLLNCLLIDFSGIFHHLTFASSTRKTDIHHTSIYSQFEMHSWYIITQWPRCSTTNIKKTIEMMQMKKKNWIFGGCERTFHRGFMHTNVTRSKCENIFIIVFGNLYLFLIQISNFARMKIVFKAFNTA